MNTPSSPEAPPYPSLIVLIVDDDPDIRRMIEWALEEEGYAVATAGDGRQALERVSAERPALVVLDIGLPLIDGYGVAARLRETHGSSVPIVMMTADGRAAEKAYRIGAAAFLRKPFEVEDLVDTIRGVLAGP